MRKVTRKYYFTVEGETEQWYLEWLERAINNEPTATCTVVIDRPIQKDPLKRAKSLSSLTRTQIIHMFDYESNDVVHATQFRTALDRMKQSEGLGKAIKYRLGYSNFTFELWVVLHKADCNGCMSHRRQYLPYINRAFEEDFDSLDQYKHETSFRRLLNKLTLSDVKSAVQRAGLIMQRNAENGLVLHQYKGYQYYWENPSLSIWESISEILTDCGL